MQIHCTFTPAETQLFQQNPEENIQFFIDAADKDKNHWLCNAVQLVGSSLQEQEELSLRELNWHLFDLFQELVSSASPEDKDQVLLGATKIFEANGWNTEDFDSQKPSSAFRSVWGYYDESNLLFLKDAALQEKRFWEEHSVYTDQEELVPYLNSKEYSLPHASRTAIQAIAKQILSAKEIPTATKIDVARGVTAIFKGYEWKLEGIHVPVLSIDDQGPTELHIPLRVLLKSPMLCNKDMIENDGSMEQPVVKSPKNTHHADLQNFTNYYSDQQPITSFSIKEWAGILSISHYLYFEGEEEYRDAIDGPIIFSYLKATVHSLEDVEATFEVIEDILPEKIAAYALQSVLEIFLEDRNVAAASAELQTLPHFAAMQQIPFEYWKIKEEETQLQVLFPHMRWLEI